MDSSQEKVHSLSYAYIPMSINDIEGIHRFHVLPSHMATAEVVLGRQWQRRYRTCLDWENNKVSFSNGYQQSYAEITPRLLYKKLLDEREEESSIRAEEKQALLSQDFESHGEVDSKVIEARPPTSTKVSQVWKPKGASTAILPPTTSALK